jgi:hypothetical protein
MPLHPYPAPTRARPSPPPVTVTTAHGTAHVYAVRVPLVPAGIGVRWNVVWSDSDASGVTRSVEAAHEALDAAICAGPVLR